MIRGALILVAAGAVGLWVTGILFSLIVPLLGLMLKVAIFVAVAYLVVRLINPEFADKMKEKCCGATAFRAFRR
ncbi:hypothetical protein [Candidatus Palauibacter sp.]|uniref:hypothetical protein n=1 Tax=Candidatus Palauibacter sp. TaxID=3101350 RepID=UPI003B014377